MGPVKRVPPKSVVLQKKLINHINKRSWFILIILLHIIILIILIIIIFVLISRHSQTVNFSQKNKEVHASTLATRDFGCTATTFEIYDENNG